MNRSRISAFAVFLLFIVLFDSIWATSNLYSATADDFKLEVQYPAVTSEQFLQIQQKWKSEQNNRILESFTQSGDPVFCKLPKITQTENLNESPKQQETKSIPPVSSVLSPLRSKCMTYIEGWWSYEFCYGKYVRQYHLGTTGLIETEYYLGKFDDHLSELESLADPQKTKSTADKTSQNHNDLSVLNQKYYEESYSHGTPCALAADDGKRSVQIRYYCSPSASSTIIKSIKEPSSCKYVLDIETPLLCSHPTYHVSVPQTTPILCYIVIPDDHKEQNMHDKDQDEFGEEVQDEVIETIVTTTSKTETQQDQQATNQEAHNDQNPAPASATKKTFTTTKESKRIYRSNGPLGLNMRVIRSNEDFEEINQEEEEDFEVDSVEEFSTERFLKIIDTLTNSEIDSLLKKIDAALDVLQTDDKDTKEEAHSETIDSSEPNEQRGTHSPTKEESISNSEGSAKPNTKRKSNVKNV